MRVRERDRERSECQGPTPQPTSAHLSQAIIGRLQQSGVMKRGVDQWSLLFRLLVHYLPFILASHKYYVARLRGSFLK